MSGTLEQKPTAAISRKPMSGTERSRQWRERNPTAALYRNRATTREWRARDPQRAKANYHWHNFWKRLMAKLPDIPL